MKMTKTIQITLLMLLVSMPVWAVEPDDARLTVTDAVVEAIDHNPMIREAIQNMAAGEASVQSARADMLPKLSAGYGYTALKQAPLMKTEGGELQIAHQRQYNWAITLVQPLFAGFALRSQYDIASLDRIARELERQRAVLDITRQVRSACYHLLLVQQLLKVSDSEVATLAAHQHDAELFYNQGLIPPNDQLKAEVALSNSLQENERVRADVKKAKIRINRLLNRPLDAELVIDDVAPASADAFNLNELSEFALQARPIMRLLNTSLKQLGLAEKVARSAWYPRVSLVGSYDHVGDNPAANENDYVNSNKSYVGLQVQWDFWQSGKTRAEISRTRWQTKALESRLESIEAQVLEEVRSALFDCQVAHKNIATAQKTLEQARENWRITDMQYQQQIATSTDILDARAFLTQADTNYFSAIYGYMNALAGLDRAIGKSVAQKLQP
jgi:outer membrane protein TolC